jgi:hypothetical protein
VEPLAQRVLDHERAEPLDGLGRAVERQEGIGQALVGVEDEPVEAGGGVAGEAAVDEPAETAAANPSAAAAGSPSATAVRPRSTSRSSRRASIAASSTRRA